MLGNVLLITIDQLRADCLVGSLAAHAPTPCLDRFSKNAATFHRHYTVTAPCGPARASLLTGLYAAKHGSVRNGTPLKPGLTNLPLEMRKLGYEPLLFGYTDTQPDRSSLHANDPDRLSYEGVLPGFREIVEMRMEHGFEWPGFLRARGYDVPVPLDRDVLYRPVDGRLGSAALYASEHSDTAYLTDRTIEGLDIRRGDSPWFAHVTYIRPHPPLVAPAPYHALIDPTSLPPPTTTPLEHPFVNAWFSSPSNHGLFWGFDGNCADMSDETTALLRAIYLGLLAEVDHHFGRLLDWLEASDQAQSTLVVVTADHGEMLGDFRMWGKESIFEQAFHIPLMIRDPRHDGAQSTNALTESVDVAPTILDWLGAQVPTHWDGRSLLPFIAGQTPASWRSHAAISIAFDDPNHPTRFQTALDVDNLCASIAVESRCQQVAFSADSLTPINNLPLQYCRS